VLRNSDRRTALLIAGLLVALAVSGGCAAYKMVQSAEKMEAAEDWDKAVLTYAKLAAQYPQETRYSIALSRTKFRASQAHFQKARKFLTNKQTELAIGELQQAVVLDPTNAFAQTELEKALQQWQLDRLTSEATEMERMKEIARKSSSIPLLDARSNIPVILQFRDAEQGHIYDVLSKATGINFLYDPKLDLKKKITIELTNVPFEKAMDTLMLTNKHFFKVMDENTILIADDNQQKRREYEDEVIKTFFLSNADVKDVQSLLRTMLDARKVVQNDQLNAITIRDTPNKIAIAQKIIESNDKAKAELIVDVELLEVNRTVSKTIGIGLTPRQYTIDFEGPDRLPLNNLGLLAQVGLYTLGPIPSVTIDFLKSDSGTRVVAKPQLRVTEGEAANLHIGDSVPIPTTTFNTTTTIGGAVTPITSFTYQEVGIVIEIEPRVHHNKEVTLKLNVEVSALGDRIDAGQGVSQPTINTRQISTVIRLKDGESSLLAGLIQEVSQASKSGYPGLMDIPGVSKVFSSRVSTNRETDLILTLTPRIIRIPDVRQQDLEALWIGNEANPKLRGDAGSVFATPFTARGEDEEEEEEDEEEAAADEEQAEPSPAAAVPAAGETAPVPAGPPATGAPAPPQAGPAAGEETAAGEDEDLGVEDVGLDEMPEADETGALPAPAQPDLSVPSPMNLSIAPVRLTVAAGGTFSLNILVNNATDLQKIGLSVMYDARTIDFDSALEGVMMKSDGSQTTFSAQKMSDGLASIEITRVGAATGITRGGALAAMRFRALAGGATEVSFGPVVAETSAGTSLTVNTTDAQVTVAN